MKYNEVFIENATCPESPCGVHTPDWDSVTVTYWTVYGEPSPSGIPSNGSSLDVRCVDCGRAGRIGEVKTLEERISWLGLPRGWGIPRGTTALKRMEQALAEALRDVERLNREGSDT